MKPKLHGGAAMSRPAAPPSREEVPVPEAHLVSLVAPTSFEAEQYRILRHAVEQRHRDSGLRTLAVTSPSGGEGKTTTSINLGGALAQGREARVLLLEADLRRPAVLRQLGLHGESPGLVEAVLDAGLCLADVIRPCPTYNLDVLPSGKPPLAPYEVLKSPRLGELFDQARAAYDYVVVDTPPVLPCPDYRLLEKAMDGTVLVVAANRTPRDLVDAALGLLDPTRVLGLVFNGDRAPGRRYQDHYYTRPSHPRPAPWLSRRR
jgi:capsular exopolysaccharide synthesis family protein